MEINYISKGGQFPYQAEGNIGNLYFYFRERHNYATLELANNESELFTNTTCHIGCKVNYLLNDKSADKLIRHLYNKIKSLI